MEETRESLNYSILFPLFFQEVLISVYFPYFKSIDYFFK